MLILDDLQWADETTLAFLIHLAEPVSQLPLVIIGSYRDEYLENKTALASGRTLADLALHADDPRTRCVGGASV